MSALGVCIGAGMAHTEDGNRQVPYALIVPQVTVSNRHLFIKEIERWHFDMNRINRYYDRGHISEQLLDRAYFAAGVIDMVVGSAEIGEYSQLIACNRQGHILGVSMYAVGRFFNTTRCYIDVQAVEPMHLRGAPGPVKVRGIGSGLLAAVALTALHAGATELFLTPLDHDARVFWLRRGFHEESSSSSGLRVQGIPEIQKLLGDCLPSRGGDFLICREITPSQVSSICH